MYRSALEWLATRIPIEAPRAARSTPIPYPNTLVHVHTQPEERGGARTHTRTHICTHTYTIICVLLSRCRIGFGSSQGKRTSTISSPPSLAHSTTMPHPLCAVISPRSVLRSAPARSGAAAGGGLGARESPQKPRPRALALHMCSPAAAVMAAVAALRAPCPVHCSASGWPRHPAAAAGGRGPVCARPGKKFWGVET